jgi:hypothetical protein
MDRKNEILITGVMLLISGKKSIAIKSLTLEIRVEAFLAPHSFGGMAICGYPIEQKP